MVDKALNTTTNKNNNTIHNWLPEPPQTMLINVLEVGKYFFSLQPLLESEVQASPLTEEALKVKKHYQKRWIMQRNSEKWDFKNHGCTRRDTVALFLMFIWVEISKSLQSISLFHQGLRQSPFK